MLALDTSHLCVVARAAEKLSDQTDNTAQAFSELLDIHYCGGQRYALTSETLHQQEQDLSDSCCSILLYAQVPPDCLDGKLEVWNDDPPHPFENTAVNERDRTLLTVADRAATSGHHVALVTDDMLLYQRGRDLTLNGSLAAMTLLSIIFIGALATCGALEPEQVATIAQVEQDHLDNRHLTTGFYQMKREKIVAVVNALACL
jgi:hypothetical protein